LDKIHHSFEQIVVEQLVNPSPVVEFKDKRKSYRTCTSNLLKENLLEPIKLHFLKGKAPYSITFEIFHESSSKSEFVTLQNIDSSSELKELYRGLKLGNHIVTIMKIVDSYGCLQDNLSENDYISISISDTPKINQLDTSLNYCVGDHIGYQLIGVPPFTLVYRFGDLTLKAVESSSQFVRYASQPGVLSINSLQDSSSNCIVNFTLPENKDLSEKLDIMIHPIPSVEISQGDSIIQDIHEGDQAEIIFSFEGTPPFALTYVRIEDLDSRGKKKSQVVETHTVNDIYAYEYRILTSLQGTYEATEVSDAYCVARNE
jgi:nucleoporin POM152